MQVVDVHVKNLRPTYQNLKEWCSNPNNIYIGRGGIVFVDSKRYPEKSSKWCNPFKSAQHGAACMGLFEAHLDELLQDESNRAEFLLLRDKTLGCWCKPGPCHGDIIVQKLDEMIEQ